MVKVQIKSEKLTPFGGIFSIMEKFDSMLSPVIDSTPVSYTHLDVYKRQDMRREKTREELNQLFYPNLACMTAGEKGKLCGTEYLLSLIHI